MIIQLRLDVRGDLQRKCAHRLRLFRRTGGEQLLQLDVPQAASLTGPRRSRLPHYVLRLNPRHLFLGKGDGVGLNDVVDVRPEPGAEAALAGLRHTGEGRQYRHHVHLTDPVVGAPVLYAHSPRPAQNFRCPQSLHLTGGAAHGGGADDVDLHRHRHVCSVHLLNVDRRHRLRDLRELLPGEGHVRRELCFPQPPQHQL